MKLSKRFYYNLMDMVAWPAATAVADIVLSGQGVTWRSAALAALAAALRGLMKLQTRQRRKEEQDNA